MPCSRARWRRLWRQQIQDYLIATVQNVRTLIRHGQGGGSVQSAQCVKGVLVSFRTAQGLHIDRKGVDIGTSNASIEMVFHLN